MLLLLRVRPLLRSSSLFPFRVPAFLSSFPLLAPGWLAPLVPVAWQLDRGAVRMGALGRFAGARRVFEVALHPFALLAAGVRRRLVLLRAARLLARHLAEAMAVAVHALAGLLEGVGAVLVLHRPFFHLLRLLAGPGEAPPARGALLARLLVAARVLRLLGYRHTEHRPHTVAWRPPPLVVGLLLVTRSRSPAHQ